MRIIEVSAHFPPNFVSGATVSTEQVALRLGSRGHEVSVFAGWTGTDRPPLAVWREESRGLTVDWVATTPWTAWSDPMNYENPPVAEHFAGLLERSRPAVVHFHSLQSLGVGLVHAAADRGVPTIVTMHDFWWWCTRQFLCDRSYRPCCLVVDAGTCPCESGRAALQQRAAVMKRALARVDRIIAVSEISARVLIANGADARRVAVVENGIAASSGTHANGGITSPAVRFLYAGGPDRMKGPHVLSEAVHRMRDVPGWTLDCYGCDVWRNRLDSPSVRIHPAFAPAELDSVMAAADVLVLPSVARESYSILAREALSRGLPVVSSDCLGPEEVVKHQANGLIVRSGDPVALAQAMRDLVEQPSMLSRLRAGCQRVPMPSEEGQVAQIEHLYQELASSPCRRPDEARSSIRRVLFVVGIDGAPLRYRAWLPAEGLRSLGVHVDVLHYRNPGVPEAGARADIVVLYRTPATVQILEFISGVRSRGIPVVFDVDDLIFVPALADRSSALGSLSDEESALWFDGVRRYRTTMEHCDAFLGSTPALVRHAGEAGLPGKVFPNGVGRLMGEASDRALAHVRRPGPLRIGYLSGTKTHQADWRMVEPAIAEVLSGEPGAQLWLVGLVEPTDLLHPYRDRIVRRPLVSWWELPGVLRDLDVHLAPLVLDEPFNECKSAIKWLEAALVSTPTVASPTGPFREVIRNGENGFLASTEQDWVRAITTLLVSTDRRTRVGAEARRDALLGFGPSLQARRYLSLLEEVRPRLIPPGPQPTGAPDEPPRVIKLEPYGPPPEGLVGRARSALQSRLRRSDRLGRASEVVHEALRTLNDQGPKALLARAARFARRRLLKRRPAD